MPQRHTPGSLEDLGHPSTSQVALAQCGTLSGTRNVPSAPIGDVQLPRKKKRDADVRTR